MRQDIALPADSYLPPLAQLLTICDGGLGDAFDCAALGLGREHAAELIRMATDEALYDADEDSAAIWAPVYAWGGAGAASGGGGDCSAHRSFAARRRGLWR